jgi:hypothetical protein
MDTSEILKTYKVIAIVGCSKDDTKYSNIVARFMKDAGYTIIPVNPTAEEILGERCYDSLLSIEGDVDIVDVFRPSGEALEITKQAVTIGAKVVWLQEGIMSDEARRYAEDREVEFIQDKCTMKEYISMQ